jgi:mannose-1-phosphate guanylyltransferase
MEEMQIYLDSIRYDSVKLTECPSESINYAVMEKPRMQLLFQWM